MSTMMEWLMVDNNVLQLTAVQMQVVVALARTRCKYIPVRSTAASLRPTVLASATTTCNSSVGGYVETLLGRRR